MSPPSVREVHAHVVAAELPLRAMVAELLVARAGRHSLARLLRELRAQLDEYRDVVERELVPLVRDADAWGRVRVENLQAEQEALTRTVRALSAGIERCAAAASDIDALRRELAAALDDCDLALEVVDAADDGPIVVDQTSG